jgi:hypothetical protein
VPLLVLLGRQLQLQLPSPESSCDLGRSQSLIYMVFAGLQACQHVWDATACSGWRIIWQPTPWDFNVWRVWLSNTVNTRVWWLWDPSG